MYFYKEIVFLYTNLLILIVNAAIPPKFPNDFSFGAGSSAYQTEGALDIDGKSENIWDHWIKSDPTHIKNNDTADMGAATFENFVENIYDAFRILPTGFPDKMNMKAITHYQTFIRYLGVFNITPVATLYHHDLPQSLQDIGGWENPDMVKYFAEYARICFQFFYRVKYWITFNDPRATCRYGYGDGSYAPGIASDGIGEYVCAQTVLKSHAAAYHIYKEEFENLNGKVSIALDLRWSEPATTTDTAAVERRNAFEFGLYANPIYKGNWPNEVIERVDYRSKNENFTKSRLPEFTEEEIDYINGTSDFMAVNLFYTHLVEDVAEADFGEFGYSKDMKAKIYLNSSWELAVNGQPIVPSSARASLVWLKSEFNDPEIFITGNGIPDENFIDDDIRISYLRNYLSAIIASMYVDEVKVFAYTAWSLYDGFEWTDGYSYKFGFLYTDPADPTYKISKSSQSFYRTITDTFTIPEEVTTTSVTPSTTPSTTPSPDSATKVSLYPALILATVLLFYVLL